MRTLLLCCAAILLMGGLPAFGQSDKALLRDLAEENKKSVEALALYPEDARLAILEAAKYPEVLIKLKNAQEKTSAAFRTLIEDFPRSTQTVFYDLSRYPGLVGSLVGRRNDPAAMRQALEVLPKEQRDNAYGVADRQMNTLVKIDDLMRTAQGVFEELIAGYPAPAQAAFRQLLDLPEVVDILNEDLRFTVLVGDVYKEDPAWVLHKMDSLNLAVAREHAEELDNWKSTIENDPQARSELQSAANEYASENGYTDEVYDGVSDDLYAGDPSEYATVEHHYYYHYPYWFGYPWWAPEPCWRPYPWWWYWGFYPHHQSIVIVYLPSYHFMHWYFWNPHHHAAYNHLSTHFVDHYYGHRHSGTSISMGVGEWRDHNRDILSDEYLRDKARLPARLKEFSQFEDGRRKFNTQNPGRTLTPAQYLEKNSKQYPDLQRSRTQAQSEIQRDNADQGRRRADWAPAKAPANPEPIRPERPAKPGVQPPAQPNAPANQAKPRETAPRPPRPIEQPSPVRKPATDEAKDYHRDQWNEPQRPARQPEQAPAPKSERPVAPKTDRAPAPRTAPSAPAPRRDAAPKTKPAKGREG